MLTLFARFLRTYFEITDDMTRVWCNLHADHGEERREIEEFWLQLLRLPRSSLTQSTVNSRSRASLEKRTNMLPYGTCRLTVHSTAIVQHLYGAIQEYGGFERPDWLDL